MTIGLGFVAAVFISNIPQAIAPSADLAAGGLLAMLTNSLIPFSYERGGSLAGAATAVGFSLSVIKS
jgi:hypothetical protein